MRNDRYESLDGIKGFALIGIIWYHLSQRSLPGGFIGVDVFFTVSGFLLALSVLREIDRTGRLRLGNFYLRRLSRLWPAMAFMIAGSVSLGLFGWRPLALLGKYSYGMYLWHWPLYLLLQLMLPGYRGSGLWVVQALTLLLSLVMTAVSWWMVENPVAEWIKSKRDKSAPRRTVAQRSAPRRVGSARARGVYGTHLNNVEFTQPYSQAAPLPSPQDAPVVASRSSRIAKTVRTVVTVSVVVLIVIGFFIGVAQAPAKTHTQIMLEKNQSALAKKERQRKMDAKAAAEAKKRAEEERKRREEAKAAIEKTMNGEDVSVIGDSVTVGASAALQKSLPGIAVDAQVSRSILTAPGIVAQMKAEGRLRKYVVISLNTNSATTVGEYEQIAAAAGDGHVLVIINAYGDREWIPVANQAASDYVRKHPTDSILVDWNSAIAAHTDWLGPDGIHPQAGQGEDLYASGLRNALVEWEAAHIE